MEDLIPILIFLFIFFALMILIGHGIWVALAWLFRQLSGKESAPQYESLNLDRCANCNALLPPRALGCTACGWRRASPAAAELFKDIGATHRQLQRLHRQGSISEEAYQELMRVLQLERERLASPTGYAPPTAQPATPRPAPTPPTVSKTPPVPVVQTPPPPFVPPESIVEDRPVMTPAVSDNGKEEVHAPVEAFEPETAVQTPAARPHAWAEDERQARRPQFEPVARKTRKPLTEVLAAFMEQSNIRWGEIIGGLLIIGCSTALVISLWNEISRIPVLKFFIFTSVTAALFGVGLYTEHRWKLPTTSRGILTIATLLVPLNFLAIAAVSKGEIPAGALVLASELIAPALFLCLVYFAGRIITHAWPHLLVFGVLGSSLGQLLVRHFAYPGIAPSRLIALGFFPLICFVVATGWMLRRASVDEEIDESLANTIFVTLGASTFASLLSLGLLLFKVGQAGETLMHLAPLLTLGGGPILASGLLLWRRIKSRELAASRTAGTSIALIGAMFALAGIALSFPNPASVVPAALIAFIIFTSVARFFDEARAHLFAAFSFALAFLVAFLSVTGQVLWQSPPRVSLLSDLFSVRSGQGMALLFVLYLAVSEGLRGRKQETASRCYLIAAGAVGSLCLLVFMWGGFPKQGDPHLAAPIFVLLAGGAFFIAWRTGQVAASWVGLGVLFLALGKILGAWLAVRFPWQAAMLAHASIASVIAITCWRKGEAEQRIFGKPLNISALIVSLAAVFALFEAYRWEPTTLYAQRLLWLAGVWLVLLWLNRVQVLFTAMQVALTCSVVLAVKLGLQNYEWYAYVRHAWLHPWSLQIQGSVLVMLSLAWVALRIFVRRKVAVQAQATAASDDESEAQRDEERLSDVAWSYLNSWLTFDRVLTAGVLCGFVLMGIYGALQGVKLELTIRGGAASSWNLAGFPHEYAYGAGAWILLALLLLTMLANLWESRQGVYALGALLALSTAVPLLAARWETSFATASAWRWLAALFLVLMSLPFWWREKLSAQLKTFGVPEMNQETGKLSQRARALLLSLTIAPVLALTIYPVLKAIEYMPVHGAASGFFYEIGAIVSYAVPLVLLSLALIGHALREREAGYAFAGGLLLNLAVTAAQLLAVASARGSMNRVVLVQVLQLNAIAAGCFALVWLSTRGWWMRAYSKAQMATADSLLSVQVGIGLFLNLLLIAPLVYWLCARPTWAGSATFEAGNVRGWLALALPLLAAFWLTRAFQRRLNAWLPFAAASAMGTLVAFDVTRWRAGTWAGYHTLLVASALTGWLMLLARKLPASLRRDETEQPFEIEAKKSRRWLAAKWEWDATLLASLAGVWTALLALRAAPSDPNRPWWSVGALVATSTLAAGLNRETLSRAYLYAAGWLLNLAASIWFLTYWNYFPGFSLAVGFFEANVIALALPGIAWLWLELRARRLNEKRQSRIPAFHHVAALFALVMLAYLVSITLLTDLTSVSLHTRAWLEWSAVLSAIALMTACLWDREARYAVAGLYLLGLIAAGMGLSQLNLSPHRLLWMLMLVLSAYAVLTSLIWRARETFMALASRWKIPARTESPLPGLKWLTAFNAVLASAVMLLGFWTVLRFVEWPMRLAGALAVGVQALTFGLLAQGERRGAWQRVALALLALGIVFFGWTWLVPGMSGTWLNRAVMLMIVMFGLIGLYGAGMDKKLLQESDWSRAAQSLISWLAGTGALALAFVLLTEVVQQVQYGGVRINLPALVTVGATLLAASIMCIFFAVSPAHDPLKLSESGRMKYVYVAEALLALLFMHIRLTMPWLFSGFFARYWPLVIVALAYIGVGLSEALRRQGLMVLAHPVERTGALLPLLPVLGYWMIDSRVDYSLVLFAIGMLYGGLSILRHSLAFGLLGALSGNGALWYLLHHTDNYKLTQHPQLWLIPISLSVLIAAYLNRERFSEEQMMSIRYVSLMTIYVSSTSDIFLNGVAESPWLPLALAGLSIAGVLCGIMFRVRAFLFLGATFLLIAIITMIYYASVNLGWTWLWYVAGIATGALIIFTFALFEKKRNEMLQVLEDLRGWER
jgi:hypothetical protein